MSTTTTKPTIPCNMSSPTLHQNLQPHSFQARAPIYRKDEENTWWRVGESFCHLDAPGCLKKKDATKSNVIAHCIQLIIWSKLSAVSQMRFSHNLRDFRKHFWGSLSVSSSFLPYRGVSSVPSRVTYIQGCDPWNCPLKARSPGRPLAGYRVSHDTVPYKR